MTTRTITGELFAYLSKDKGPDDLREHGVAALSFFHIDGMQAIGYTLIGKASITVEAPDEQGLIDSKVASLKAEIQKTRADSEAKCTQLAAKIQTLLAISFDEAWASGGESGHTEFMERT